MSNASWNLPTSGTFSFTVLRSISGRYTSTGSGPLINNQDMWMDTESLSNRFLSVTFTQSGMIVSDGSKVLASVSIEKVFSGVFGIVPGMSFFMLEDDNGQAWILGTKAMANTQVKLQSDGNIAQGNFVWTPQALKNQTGFVKTADANLDYKIKLYQSGSFINGYDTYSGIVSSGQTAVASSGGTVLGGTVTSGATVILNAAAVTSTTTVSGQGLGAANNVVGAILVGAGGSSISDKLIGGYMAVQGTGAISRDAIISNNGWQDIGYNNRTGAAGGGVASGTILRNAKQFISSGGSAADTVISAGGTEVISTGGRANNTVINSGGSVSILGGGYAQNATVSSGGTLTGASGATLDGGTISFGGSATLDPNALIKGQPNVYGSL
ncbi:hypothetical protein ACFFGM_05280, partial [Asaia krungthepensis]